MISRSGTESGSALPYTIAAVLGAVLLGMAALSARLSRLGVIVVGFVHVAFALLYVLWPMNPAAGQMSPAVRVTGLALEFDQGLGAGLDYLTASGTSLVIGSSLLVVGIATPSRRRPSAAVTVLSALGGVLAIGLTGAVAVIGGAFERNYFVYFRHDLGLAVALAVLGLLVGVALLATGRSPLGTWIAGVVITAAGAVMLFPASSLPELLSRMIPRVSVDFLTITGWSGMLLGIGCTLLGLALATTLRPTTSRRSAAGSAAARDAAAPEGFTAA
jgi:hypothetical protein